MPRVTVVIATYNWSSVLPYSIASVLEQTFDDFELLVVGDGCTDDSAAIVRAIGDPRVEWIDIDRTGHQSGPNNEGLRRAKGEIVAYLGHDDLWLPHHLAQHVAALDAGHELTCSLAAFVWPDSSSIDTSVPDFQRLRVLPPSALAHRRDAARAIGGWRDHRELRISPEFDLVARIAAAGGRTFVVPRLTVIKFPASLRRNVYRDRPSHEQAAWLQRIRTEADLEAAVLAQIVTSAPRQIDGTMQRIWRILSHPSLWWSVLNPRRGARVRAHQRYKGVR